MSVKKMYPLHAIVPSLFVSRPGQCRGPPHYSALEAARDSQRLREMVSDGQRRPETARDGQMARDGLRWLEMAPGVVESVLPAAREQAFMQSHRYREMSRDGQSRRRAYGHQRLRGARAL